MSDNTGGSAFPRLGLKVMEPNGTIVPHEPGMTLRDYFAAKAMQSVIAGVATRADEFIYSECAALSYEMADAMLKAREQ